MNRILVLLPNNLGDVIMALPMLDGMKKKYPGSYIVFFVEDGYEAALEHCGTCDSIYRFDRKKIRDCAHLGDWKKGIEEFQVDIDYLKMQQFDTVINLAQHSYVSYVVALIGVENVYGAIMLRDGNRAIFDSWSQYLYAIPFARTFNSLHAADVYKRIAGVQGKTECCIKLTETEKTKAHEYLHKNNVPVNARIVVLQPGAAFQSKRWSVENFIALGKMLTAEGYYLLITGAPSEIDIAFMIAQEFTEQCLNSAGKLTFRENIAVVSFCEMCVTGDTALMHAASALNKKVFALFGSTNPVETGPYGNGHIILAGRCASRPCFCTECRTQKCMKAISPETVMNAIRDNLTTNNHPECDTYKTVITDTGDYSLQPIAGTTDLYYTVAGSVLTQRAFDQSLQPVVSDDNWDVFRSGSEQILTGLMKMEYELTRFDISGSSDSLRNFEQTKQELASVKGIGEWWTALLNIRLNSVPLLDINRGIKDSRAVCRLTREQITSAVSL